MTDIQISVMPALRLRGSLKAVMPLEMASTPVSAVVPLAKGMQDQERRDRLHAVNGLHRRRIDHRAQRARQVAEQADADRHEHHDQEEVGGNGKGRARFPARRAG